MRRRLRGRFFWGASLVMVVDIGFTWPLSIDRLSVKALINSIKSGSTQPDYGKTIIYS